MGEVTGTGFVSDSKGLMEGLDKEEWGFQMVSKHKLLEK